MTGRVLRRTGWAVLVAWFAVTLTFVMVAAIPADPIRALAPHAPADVVARMRAYYCLDRGLAGQYACFVGHVAHGNLGESLRDKQPVTAVIAERAWPTVQLALAAVLLQLAIGVPLGVAAARRRGRWQDHAAGLGSLVGQAAPPFLAGMVLLYLFAFRLGWFPIGGYGSGVLDRLWHLVLPAATLACAGVAYYARAVRSELVDALAADYVRTARAKGLAERRIVWGHALRNALGPLVTLTGLDLGLLLGGAVVVEYIFGWPGLGRELFLAILEHDGPVIVGIVLIGALAISLVNLMVDLLYLWLDPRLRE